MSAPIPRVGGRVIVLDPDDRVLLIHEGLEHGGAHWLTPGGGVEEGETPAQAALREAVEETGAQLTLDEAAGEVLSTNRLWSWAGVHYDQVDHFYLARVPEAFDPAPVSLTAPEQLMLLGHRWWVVEDLIATTETVRPQHLGEVVRGLLAR